MNLQPVHDAAALCRVASDNGFLESLRTVVLLSPTAPNLVMSKSRAGKTGGLMRARMPANATRDLGVRAKAGKRAWLSKLPEASAAEYSGAGSKRRCCSKTFISSRRFIVHYPSFHYSLPTQRSGQSFNYSAAGFHPSEPARKAAARYFFTSASLNCFEYGSRFAGLLPAPVDEYRRRTLSPAVGFAGMPLVPTADQSFVQIAVQKHD